uniref:Secreted protein n=1 Tax=Pyxicephalus adspersus TaxID=30357 RepID=A0AAV2ZQ39_PYXAD|nr:TPA: hypothetical protein GDO54_004908 [Pyxicephalus adspersus]
MPCGPDICLMCLSFLANKRECKHISFVILPHMAVAYTSTTAGPLFTHSNFNLSPSSWRQARVSFLEWENKAHQYPPYWQSN